MRNFKEYWSEQALVHKKDGIDVTGLTFELDKMHSSISSLPSSMNSLLKRAQNTDKHKDFEKLKDDAVSLVYGLSKSFESLKKELEKFKEVQEVLLKEKEEKNNEKKAKEEKKLKEYDRKIATELAGEHDKYNHE